VQDQTSERGCKEAAAAVNGALKKMRGRNSLNSVHRASLANQAEQIVSTIAHRLSLELDGMKELLGGGSGSDTIDAISAEMSSQLTAIRGLIADDQIFPQCNLRLSQGAEHGEGCDRALRVGVFPTAGDPFHWMHLLSGLKAMAICKLDKVIYVIAGSDSRKPDLLRADVRHRMAQEILGLFFPLFAYSPIALDNTMDGETNIFRILQLNQKQKVDAFYIAGTDHYYRCSPRTGKPDTIQKLENGVKERVFGYDERMSSVSAIFVGRGKQQPNAVDTFLNIDFIQGMPLEASSTSIRKALTGRGPRERLAILPYSVLTYIRRSALYPEVGKTRRALDLQPGRSASFSGEGTIPAVTLTARSRGSEAPRVLGALNGPVALPRAAAIRSR
jgi:nicotinic acid mononucleotide adenylyltransferase